MYAFQPFQVLLKGKTSFLNYRSRSLWCLILHFYREFLTSSLTEVCMRHWLRTRPSRDGWLPTWPGNCWTVFPDFGISWIWAYDDRGTTAGPWRSCIQTMSFGCLRLCNVQYSDQKYIIIYLCIQIIFLFNCSILIIFLSDLIKIFIVIYHIIDPFKIITIVLSYYTLYRYLS